MSNLVRRDQNGVDRCQRVVEAVVPNNPKNPAEGHKRIKGYCNKPMTMSVAENRKVCPDCDKQPPIGWVKPRVTNAADVPLTPKEMAECGLNPDGTRIDGKPITQVAPTQTDEAIPAVEAKVEVKKDEVVLSVPLKDLEANDDVAAYLIRKVIDGFGELPVTNFKESKRLIQLEEKLNQMLRA